MIDLFGIEFHAIYIHLGALVLTIPFILLADIAGFAWVRGRKQMLSARYIKTLHILVGVGLTVMILSGAYMAWPLRDYFSTEPAFWIKMFFVLTLVINSFFIGALMKTASRRTFAELSDRQKKKFFISGGVSTVGWIGAFVAALYMSTSSWVAYFLSQFLGLF